VVIEELSPTEATRFQTAIRAGAASRGFIGASVEVKDVGELEAGRMFLTPDGLAGVMVKADGDITSVFKHKDGSHHSLRDLLQIAVESGGTKLDAFDSYLPQAYGNFGFVAESRTPFNDEFAPPGWDYAAFEEAGMDPRPDIVFMRYAPAEQRAYTAGEGQVFDEYDAAFDHRDDALGAAQTALLEAGDAGPLGAFNPQTLGIRLFADAEPFGHGHLPGARHVEQRYRHRDRHRHHQRR